MVLPPTWSSVVLCVALTWSSTLGDTFTMGYLTGSRRRPDDRGYPRPGITFSGALTLAVAEINALHPLRGNHSLAFRVAETFGEETESVLQTAVLWTKNVSVYIGPQETCAHEARMAASFNLPMISYFCAHHETSNKELFPTFARTRPPDTQISNSVASLLLHFRWRKVALLYSVSNDSSLVEVAKTIIGTVEQEGIEVRFIGTWQETYHHGYAPNPFVKLVEDSYRETRIYVVLGYYFEHMGLLVSLQDKGLLDSGEYFVVGVDVEQYDRDSPLRYMQGLLRDEVEDATLRAFGSYMGVVGTAPEGFEDFTIRVNKYNEMAPFNFPNPVGILGGMKKVPAEGAYLYDAVYLYARALNECLSEGDDPYDGKAIFRHIRGRTYNSAMGYLVYLNAQGDAEGNYTLIARRSLSQRPGGHSGVLPVGLFHHRDNSSTLPALRLLYPIDWVGGQGPPVDEPACGFHNEKCIMWKIATGVTGGVFLALLLILFVVYKNWAYEQELDSLLWKIEFREVQLIEHVPLNTSGKAVRSIHPVIRTSQVSLSSNPDADFRYSALFTQIGIYKGRICAIKSIRKKTVDITRDMKKELKTMRDLRHDNVNVFVGACVEPPNLCVISEYCARGSLQDILENEDVKLDNMFVASLVADIIRGMMFLHESAIRSHGNLKSTNCLVDSRWVLKISDFGLHELKKDADTGDDATDFEKQCQHLLWRAPELLRDPNTPPGGTKKGDVYSFAIILYELVGRHGPYGSEMNEDQDSAITPSEVIQKVMRREVPPFRPRLDLLENAFDCVRDCMHDCWQEDPDLRPDFKSIREKLRPMRKGMKPNIFDNMLAMMEKYANNLEALVDDRTDQLIEEKKKTDALLYEMLPRYVADQLKQGHKIEAESFDLVTIYFSDIVGFTTMSAESSPLQVVDFLNDLYTCFDSIIGHYDVYKVETIGDAYMVVSGLPIRNGDQHAGQVASMALSLLDAVRKFKIRHRPQDKLMLRIGMHTGPVCAGVVGLKMPRYCLFGDTVNTASRMESTGMPLRIHCSLECKMVLEKLGGYQLEDGGITNIKGKGELRTFWLVGEDDTRRWKVRSQKGDHEQGFCRSGPGDPKPLRSSLRKQVLPRSAEHYNSSPELKRLRFANHDHRRSGSSLKCKPGGGTTQSADDLSGGESSNATKQSSCPCLSGDCPSCTSGHTMTDHQRDIPVFTPKSDSLPLLTRALPGELNLVTSPVTEVANPCLKLGFRKCLEHSESEPFLPHRGRSKLNHHL